MNIFYVGIVLKKKLNLNKHASFYTATMKIIKRPFILLFIISLSLVVGSCEDEDIDPCAKTKWPLKKTYEIRLAIHFASNNPALPGSTSGSQYPADFKELVVSGTIEKIKCDSVSVNPVNLGNTYIEKGVDWPAPVDVPKAYWFGHVIYVYEFENDKDYIDIHLKVKITMNDGKSYMCDYSEEVFYQKIIQMPMELYHYVLVDVYTTQWTKV